MITMTLDEYLKLKYDTSAGLAKKLGVPSVSISNWRYGNRPIPIIWMPKIELVTSGFVTRKDLCEKWQEYWPELAEKRSGTND